MRRERESPINPEIVWGREFRVPAIIGLGSGQGFDFEGLHLPHGWEKAIPKLREINPAIFQVFFDGYCAPRGFNPGVLRFDSATGVLREITVMTKPLSRLYLDTEFVYAQEGLYKGKNVDNLEVAIILQKVAIAFLDQVAQEIGREYSHPYIDGNREDRGYWSANLEIPKEYLEPKEPVTNAYYQRDFEMRASNIAGRFGLSIRMISFDERGLLDAFDVHEGDACGYYLDRNRWSGEYHGHNVDTPYQVASLHGIAASFINDLLKRKDKAWY